MNFHRENVLCLAKYWKGRRFVIFNSLESRRFINFLNFPLGIFRGNQNFVSSPGKPMWDLNLTLQSVRTIR